MDKNEFHVLMEHFFFAEKEMPKPMNPMDIKRGECGQKHRKNSQKYFGIPLNKIDRDS